MIYHIKIKVYITFQDIYGATGNNTKAVDELKKLCCEQDTLIHLDLSRLKKKFTKKHFRSKFKLGKNQDEEI